MIVKCDQCNLEYDDFDHITFCPHARFSASEDIRQLQREGKLRQDSGPEGDPH
jgi:hypothetical protein